MRSSRISSACITRRRSSHSAMALTTAALSCCGLGGDRNFFPPAALLAGLEGSLGEVLVGLAEGGGGVESNRSWVEDF